MICKYCHLKTHYIDNCPTIICKICKEVGHPQWSCKIKKNNKKMSYGDDFKKKNDKHVPNEHIENTFQKNISYYLKIQNDPWSDRIDII